MIFAVYRTEADTCNNSNEVFVGYVEAETLDEVTSRLPDHKIFYGWSVRGVLPMSLDEVLVLGSDLEKIFGR